jgi:hypothetical protein
MVSISTLLTSLRDLERSAEPAVIIVMDVRAAFAAPGLILGPGPGKRQLTEWHR